MMNQKMLQMMEDARNASWINFQSWLMDNGEKMMIATNESDKRWLESKGYTVKVSFKCGEEC